MFEDIPQILFILIVTFFHPCDPLHFFYASHKLDGIRIANASLTDVCINQAFHQIRLAMIFVKLVEVLRSFFSRNPALTFSPPGEEVRRSVLFRIVPESLAAYLCSASTYIPDAFRLMSLHSPQRCGECDDLAPPTLLRYNFRRYYFYFALDIRFSMYKTFGAVGNGLPRNGQSSPTAK